MNTSSFAPQTAPLRSAPDTLGRVLGVSGAQVTIGLHAMPTANAQRATVGRFVGVTSGSSMIVGMITEITERSSKDQDASCRSTALLDLVGEIKLGSGTPFFQRGVTEYPMIGEPATLMTDRELRLIYSGKGVQAQIGTLQQDPTIPATVDIDNLVDRHFAVIGTTGVGKSNGVAIILQRILDEKPTLRIFLIDPHNEYGRCFGDKAQVLTPRNLRLPFWLFNFEETIDAFFGARPGIEEEVEILSEVIPLAKAAYGQYKGNNGSAITKKKETRSSAYGVDTPVPYRIEDLLSLIDERMGKLENRSSRMVYHKLMQRIQTFRNHPRYGFMFENATVGGDTMAEVLSHLFRLPANGKPMTIMQLAGFPAEVVDSVVSVLSRMAFDFGLWSDGASPLLFVCEEAHRYAPSDSKIGFGPTRRALSRIAKEGRKYGVFLGLVTQRPAEIDAIAAPHAAHAGRRPPAQRVRQDQRRRAVGRYAVHGRSCSSPFTRAAGRQACVDEAAPQFLVHARYLSDPENGVVVPRLDLRRQAQFRARAVGPRQCLDHGRDSDLVENGGIGKPVEPSAGVLRAQVDALLQLQAPSGAWHTVLDDPSIRGDVGDGRYRLRADERRRGSASVRRNAVRPDDAVLDALGDIYAERGAAERLLRHAHGPRPAILSRHPDPANGLRPGAVSFATRACTTLKRRRKRHDDARRLRRRTRRPRGHGMERLRAEFLIEGRFALGAIEFVYTHVDRMIVGGAALNGRAAIVWRRRRCRHPRTSSTRARWASPIWAVRAHGDRRRQGLQSRRP